MYIKKLFCYVKYAFKSIILIYKHFLMFFIILRQIAIIIFEQLVHERLDI